MTNSLFFRPSLFLATIFLALGLIAPLPAHAAISNTSLMEDAYATLGSAKHDYKGHRVKAMKQIEAAFNESGWKIKGIGKVHESQATSDVQLRSARSLLQQAGVGLSGKAQLHVNNAIAQIDDALAIK